MILQAFGLVCVFSVEISIGFEFTCSPQYLRMSLQHSMCKIPNPTCKVLKKGVTQDDKGLIIQLHNEYRSLVASGNESEAGMPPAADMLEMVWDDELAELAQKHAETCFYVHDCNECRALEHFMVGQNIAMKWITKATMEKEKDWNWFIHIVIDEISIFPKSLIGSFMIGEKDPKPQYGHFSQLVWGKSWRIGCGWVLFQSGIYNSSYYVCNYGPAGNVDDEEVYEEGTPCSYCPRNSCCGETCEDFNITATYPGLCVVVDQELPPDGFGPHDLSEFFFCDFYDEIDCDRTTSGRTDWKFVETIGGNYISIVLNGGETATMMMNTPLRNPSASFCFKLLIRSGAEVEGHPSDFHTVVNFLSNSEVMLTFGLQRNDFRQQFITYRMDVNMPTDVNITVSLAFSVPSAFPPQYIEIKEISATENQCQWDK